jgi:hypothetical protein
MPMISGGGPFMRHLFLIAAAVGLVLAGCSTPAAPEPDISLAGIYAAASGGDFVLAAPDVVVCDLSRLKIGMTKAEVSALFSKPRTVRFTPKDEYWEYDWFELYFREGRLANWFNL